MEATAGVRYRLTRLVRLLGRFTLDTVRPRPRCWATSARGHCLTSLIVLEHIEVSRIAWSADRGEIERSFSVSVRSHDRKQQGADVPVTSRLVSKECRQPTQGVE